MFATLIRVVLFPSWLLHSYLLDPSVKWFGKLHWHQKMFLCGRVKFQLHLVPNQSYCRISQMLVPEQWQILQLTAVSTCVEQHIEDRSDLAKFSLGILTPQSICQNPNVLPRRCSNTAGGCPQRLWNLQPWRQSKLDEAL